MKKTVGFGVVGAGLIAPFHLNAVKDSAGGKAVGIFDIDLDRARKIAEQFGIKAYRSLVEMLVDDKIQVVCVATPNHLHHDIVIAAAEAGKHVLTEKPPAMSLAETDEMIAACEKAGVKFGCFVQCRIRKAIKAMKFAVEKERFGKLLRADAYMKWYRPPEYYTASGWRGKQESGSGVTVAQGFHYIDLLQHLAGPAIQLEAKMNNLNHPDISLEDDAIAFVNYANGAQGVIQLSTALWPGTDIRIELNGTDGTAIMSGEVMQCWKFKEEQPEDVDIRKIGNAAQATGAGGAADFGHVDHTVVVQDMINCIDTAKDVVIPVKSVRPTLEIVLAMYQSAYRKASVQWPIFDDPEVWKN
ncbi:MAG: Gfo/Idh/MocA family oxidoreductase [Kiritimatiellales bacterium]